MFKNKESFKKEFIEHVANKYGHSLENASMQEKYNALAMMVKEYATNNYKNSLETLYKTKQKELIYLSMEFLIGRLLINNLQNLGIYDIVKKGLADLNIDLNELEEKENDAGLGNGGLGRLAACFLDSIASLGYVGHGNCLRFEYGFFKQKLGNGYQKELPDEWLVNGYEFEEKKMEHAVKVYFYGYSETYTKKDGSIAMRTGGATPILAVPYDVNVVGYHNNLSNTLRLWSAEPCSEGLPSDVNFNNYLYELKEICHNLYPDDSNEYGKMLRLKQEYFLVSSALQCAVKSHLNRHPSLDNFGDYYVIHLNDTHPVLAIVELMRILMDEHDFSWDNAFAIVKKCMAYTNHTVLPEALEKWPVHFVQRLIPRCYAIIEEIHRRFMVELSEKKYDDNFKNSVSIVKDGQIYMANLAVYVAYSVNGVAKIHSDILTKLTFKDFYSLYPEKFNNKTNGVTHRRWLLNANPNLAKLISKEIGEDWIMNPDKLSDLTKFENDATFLNKLMKVKSQNKIAFADFVKNTYGIEINPKSIFDVQVKRLHAYKRQLLCLFYIIHLYYKIKGLAPKNIKIVPHTFIFGAKAAPSYYFAKKVIELILSVANTINNDPDVSKYIKIVFVENYGVSLAEKIIPAADISEQISTAGYEASGTSNMKLMMNGAITLGTLDGANIEINELAKEGHNVIFGLNADEVEQIKKNNSFSPYEAYNNDSRIHRILDSLFTGPWVKDPNQFRPIFDEIMNKHDEYLVLKDFNAYVNAQEKVEKLYQDKNTWAVMSLYNIAGSGPFSSDRTINEYNNDVWHLKKIGE